MKNNYNRMGTNVLTQPAVPPMPSQTSKNQVIISQKIEDILTDEQKKKMEQNAIQRIREDVIDEFMEKMNEKIETLFRDDGGGLLDSSYERAYNSGLMDMNEAAEQIAERMKAEFEREQEERE